MTPEAELQALRACLAEVDRLMDHCEEPTEWRERWQALLSTTPPAHCGPECNDAAVAAERERYAPLMQAVEWLLDAGHMSQEHLARLRAAWEALYGPTLGGAVDTESET